ncbi:MAG: cephalosporin hydroxylase family protein [Bacteroidota bacterium]
MNQTEQFERERDANILALSENTNAKESGLKFMLDTAQDKYTYNFSWLGRPIIQYPQDMIALQEIIWETSPDLIIETGIAHGGSLIFSASILKMLGNEGQVLGVDIDIRDHNRVEIEKHPLAGSISMIQGSSIDESTIKEVHEFAEGKPKVMVILDSNHTHDHVLAELQAYSSLVTAGCYLVVFDTAVEDMPDDYDWGVRTWGKGNNPKTAVWEFLKSNKDFVIDEKYDNKLIISVAPNGYLKKI